MEHNTIKILQWNARRINNKKEDIHNFLYKQDINLAIITESWLNNTKELNIPTYNIIRNDRQDGKGGVAILIKSNITYKIIKNPTINNYRTTIFNYTDKRNNNNRHIHTQTKW